MSRMYCMSVEIKNFDIMNKPDIKDAAARIWHGFSNWSAIGHWPVIGHPGGSEPEFSLLSEGNGGLMSGESEGEFTDRLARAIWEANDGYCLIYVTATCLEDLPCTYHDRNKKDYKRLLEQPGGADEEDKEEEEG